MGIRLKTREILKVEFGQGPVIPPIANRLPCVVGCNGRDIEYLPASHLHLLNLAHTLLVLVLLARIRGLGLEGLLM